VTLQDADTAEAYAIALAYQLGFAAGGHAQAIRAEAIYATWRAAPRLTWEQQVAARVAGMEAIAAASGRPEYRGGPVDWETGQPVATPLAVAA
jgi:hypothetical protein